MPKPGMSFEEPVCLFCAMNISARCVDDTWIHDLTVCDHTGPAVTESFFAAPCAIPPKFNS